MISLRFKQWKKFTAVFDESAVSVFLVDIQDAALDAVKRGVAGPKSGRIYARKGGSHRASAAGEYPAKDSGGLLSSLNGDVSRRKVEIGTNKFYAAFLREGTSKMARRKMSDDAMREAINETEFTRHFAKWRR